VSRGGLNIDYAQGFKLEEQGFKRYEKAIKHVLNAKHLECTARSLVDKATGIDCYAQIQGYIVGISLRVRNKDYNSFTLNRHIDDEHSEVKKWIAQRHNHIKPATHLQIAPTNQGVKVWRINIDAFSLFIQRQINTNNLYSYYNERMRCYEFKHSQVSGVAGISVFELDNSFT